MRSTAMGDVVWHAAALEGLVGANLLLSRQMIEASAGKRAVVHLYQGSQLCAVETVMGLQRAAEYGSNCSHGRFSLHARAGDAARLRTAEDGYDDVLRGSVLKMEEAVALYGKRGGRATEMQVVSSK